MIADQLLVILKNDLTETQETFLQDLNHPVAWIQQISSDESLFVLHFLPDGSSITTRTAEEVLDAMTTLLEKIKQMNVRNPEVHVEPIFCFESL